MSFTVKSVGPRKSVVFQSETITLPASGVGYTSAIPNLAPDPKEATNFVTITVQASAVSGTNLDIGLYGSDSETGTKVLLLDAPVADITGTTLAVARVDLNLYPAGYYFIGATVDASEAANTLTVKVFAKA